MKILLVFLASLALVCGLNGALYAKSAHIQTGSASGGNGWIVSEINPLNWENAVMYARSSSVYQYYRRSDGFPRHMPASGSRVFVFDPGRRQYGVYGPNGKRIKTGRASGGKGYCSDVRRSCRTPRGVFRIFNKRGYWCRSSKYPLGKGGAHMPYCMFFHRAGYAIHGSNDVPNYNASHGCIRLRPKDAAWMHKYFIRIGTVVVVRDYH